MSYYIHAAKFFLPNTTENRGWLEITDEGKFGEFITNKKPNGQIKDYGDQWVAPGLVDTHIHGSLGYEVMDNDWHSLEEISKGLLKGGVTSWLPTTVTGSFDQINAICRTIGTHAGEESGAKIQGIYLEGPYFTAEHKGAENPHYFRDPSTTEFDQWQDSAHGLIKKIAMAPERHGATDFIEYITRDCGKVVTLAHASATYEQAKACVDAGASMFAHTFNGMNELGHRDPGMAGAAMNLQGIDDELICDGFHVDPAIASILINLKTPEHIALITDCMSGGLMPDDDYMLGELPVTVNQGQARLKSDGHLAGSVLSMRDAVKNVVDWNVATPTEAVEMGAKVPAKSSKIEGQCGSIRFGHDADFLILNPDMSLSETYLDGVSRYRA